MIILILWLAFQRISFISFYLFFELSILPVLFLILGWGYQPERISSSFFIFFYTLFGSLPLLIGIIWVIIRLGGFQTHPSCDVITPSREIFSLILLGAFFVKLPLYFTHMWLPKAHVEAPVVGSIILAGLILKLGGYGLLLCNLFPLLLNSFVMLVVCLSVLGAGVVGLLISRLTDIKVIIAYSSVVHIRLVAVCAISGGVGGLIGLVLIIICHGFTSPGIFAGANIIYERSHSRRALLNKGLLRSTPSLTLFWFSLVVLNFGGPFTANLLSEILLINTLSRISLSLLGGAAAICFFSLVYNLILYASLNQGVGFNYLAGQKLVVREIVILFNIIYPSVFFLMSVQI
jgi:NADH-ubiquinone oxidoreductase chain 4